MSGTTDYASAKQINEFEQQKLGLKIQILELDNTILDLQEKYYGVEGTTAAHDLQRAEYHLGISVAALEQDGLEKDIDAIDVKIEEIAAASKQTSQPSFLEDLMGFAPPFLVVIADEVLSGLRDFGATATPNRSSEPPKRSDNWSEGDVFPFEGLVEFIAGLNAKRSAPPRN